MRIRKILAISVIVLLGGIILWGCRNRENVSSQENSLSEEVCEIAKYDSWSSVSGYRGSGKNDQ